MGEERNAAVGPGGGQAPWAVPGSGDIVVEVDPDIEELVPMFLENRLGDVEALRQALNDGDKDTIEDLGHRMKGMGGGYGFEYISRAGAALEEGASEGRLDELRGWIDGLEEYLSRVEAVPGEPEEFDESAL